MSDEYDWVELHPRPKKDGLHDSGYRYIHLVGVNMVEVDGERVREQTDLQWWSDHVVLNGVANIDVEPDGTIRLMQYGGGKWQTSDFQGSSSAFFRTTTPRRAQRWLESDARAFGTWDSEPIDPAIQPF